MQNVYDLAHELVRSLKETDQFKDYKDAQKALKANDQVNAMMNDFQQKSMEFQAKT
ncbi:MAG: YlbF family regulator, partial [Firmicutes bacterium]|nr:YlbF family regulator [Bacillota bacterium]